MMLNRIDWRNWKALAVAGAALASFVADGHLGVEVPKGVLFACTLVALALKSLVKEIPPAPPQLAQVIPSQSKDDAPKGEP